MIVKFNVGMAGAGVLIKPGDVLDRPDAEAKRLIAAGIAEPFTPEKPAKKAPRKKAPAKAKGK